LRALEDICTFVTIPHCILAAIRNVLDKPADRIKTHILFHRHFSPKSCHLWNELEK